MLSLLLPLILVGFSSTSDHSLQLTPDTIRYRSQDVHYGNGAVPLAAELLLPEGRSRYPGAVIIQGSGESDRTNPWARAIAMELVGRGVAVLLTDKRGSGMSGGSWQEAGFDELAEDALAGVEYLRGHQQIDAARVGVVGLSQGGWIAPVAAARSDNVAFVIGISGATVSFAEQSMAEMANTARQSGLAEAQVHEVLALNRAAAKYVLTGEWGPYAAARSQGLRSAWSQIAEGYPPAPDLPIWTYLRKVADFDPLPYWIVLDQPVLMVYGAEDEHDNVPVAESVRRLEHAFRTVGKENQRIVVLPHVGHSLWRSDQTREFAPEFGQVLTTWIQQQLTGGASQ